MSSLSDLRTIPSRVSVLRAAAAAPMELPALEERHEPAATALAPNVVEESRTVGYEAGLTAGHAEGFTLGYDKGIAAAEVELEALRAAVAAEREQGRQAVASALHAIDAAVRQIGPEGHDLFEHLQSQLATAAVTLAEAIVGRELRDPEHRGVDAIARVLAFAPDRVPVTVRLHPEDAALVTAAEPNLGDRDVSIIEDASLMPGDAVAELSDSEIDGRMQAAIERVRIAMGVEVAS